MKGSEKFAFLVRESESGAHKREREGFGEVFECVVWLSGEGTEQESY